MAAPGDVYERELKSLLTGEEKAVSKMVKTCSSMETAGYMRIPLEPFLVIRAAGSLGVDLVALRWDFSFPIEVKSSSDTTLHFSKSQRLIEQADRMLDDCCRSHLVPIYAYRLKGVRGDPWRVFTIPTDHQFKGRHAILYRRMPKIGTTSEGNYVMHWEDGMKLSDLILYMGMSDYSVERPSELIGLITRQPRSIIIRSRSGSVSAERI
ncbi:MAG: Holliday junction resolvase [Candidatus Methanomethylophilaceae archaeon]|nr:Holliday junction resolvase [Candidatus Methanomethylophilaceae archaeon]